jgi:hypothetical protein
MKYEGTCQEMSPDPQFPTELDLSNVKMVLRRDLVEEKPELLPNTAIRTFRQGDHLVLAIVVDNKN